LTKITLIFLFRKINFLLKPFVLRKACEWQLVVLKGNLSPANGHKDHPLVASRCIPVMIGAQGSAADARAVEA